MAASSRQIIILSIFVVAVFTFYNTASVMNITHPSGNDNVMTDSPQIDPGLRISHTNPLSSSTENNDWEREPTPSKSNDGGKEVATPSPTSGPVAKSLGSNSPAEPRSDAISPYSNFQGIPEPLPDYKIQQNLFGGPNSRTNYVSPQDQECDSKVSEYQFEVFRVRYENRITICEGPTTIECLIDAKDGIPKVGKRKKAPPPPALDPVVKFCFATNLYPPLNPTEARCKTDASNEAQDCHWRAYCSPSGHWAEQGGTLSAPLFDGLGQSFNWMKTGAVRVHSPEETPSQPSTSQNDDQDVLRYIVHGDCGGSWNPGHCTADLINFSLVQRILGYDASNSIAYLMRGLNYDDMAGTGGARGKPLWALWEALSKEAYPRKEAYDSYPKNVDVPVGGIVAFSPSPASSIWWGFGNCRGLYASEIIRNFRQTVEPRMDSEAKRIWDPGFLSRSSIRVHNLDTQIDLLYDLENLILVAARGGKRTIHNREEMFDTIISTFPNAKVAMISLDQNTEYLYQYALWRRAKVVIGVHGGNLGGSIFLSPGQTLIEGSFECKHPKPSMFAVMTTSNAASYRCAQVSGNMDTGGPISIQDVITALREIF